ncbi:MAG: endonuclease/exonuclease/phosphatase family protein [Burkholderiales bacterium]
MYLITWNIQWGRGIDGIVDLGRIARTAREMADFDVLCLQEVAINFPGLPGNRGEAGVAELSRLLPEYSAHFGSATDVPDSRGRRSQFGNLIFSRLPVFQVFRHLLPWPADPDVKSMQRGALEVVASAPWGPLRILTTHLEYYSPAQRTAQVDALRHLHAEACNHAQSPRKDGESGEPFESTPRPASAILTGDFNFQPGSPEYFRLVEPFSGDTPALLDAWSVAHAGTPHPPTAGVHENSWAKAPYCCDFLFITANLAPRLRHIAVNTNTQASDHQPLLLEVG